MKFRRFPGRSLRRGFWRARDGATALELAFVFGPFCFMLFAIAEIALIFTIDSVLDNAVIETGRLIRTGQAFDASMTAEDFEEDLCDRMTVFASHCRAAGTTTVDVRVVPQFAVPLTDPSDDGVLDPSEVAYTNGGPGNLILVRVWYRQPLLTAYLAPGVTPWTGGTRLLRSATAFRNEPR